MVTIPQLSAVFHVNIGKKPDWSMEISGITLFQQSPAAHLKSARRAQTEISHAS